MKKIILMIALISSCMHAESADELIKKGNAALRQKNKDAALAFFDQALTQAPSHPEALYGIGLVHHCAQDGAKALHYLKQSYEHNSDHTQYIYAYALAAYHAGHSALARDIIETHFGAEPNNAELRTKLLPLYLRDMDWYYALKLCNVNDLQWNNADVHNKIVLLDLSSEWNGHGDVMQIVRYAKQLYAAGAYVLAYVRPELLPLLSLCPYLVDVISCKQPKPLHDVTYALTADRLTLALRKTLRTPSKDVPYLHADAHLCKQWKQKIAQDTGLKVGICFASTKLREFFSGKVVAGPRGMDASEITPLFSAPGVQFYNLQVRENEQVKKFNSYPNVHVFDQLDRTSGAFMDTAALITQLDLVITVDTSIAHLAGGLGVPVWVMLPFAADFRWFEDRSDSPWYPTMRLFKQTRQGEWRDVIENVKQELALMSHK